MTSSHNRALPGSAHLPLRTLTSRHWLCSSTCLLPMFTSLFQDPVNASPAVLVKKYDITPQKELELKLFIQQQELQRSATIVIPHMPLLVM